MFQSCVSWERGNQFHHICFLFRKASQKTVNSGSASRRTVTTLTPRSYTGTTGPAGSGTWPSTREGRPKWAPARGSNPSTCPRIFCPGWACTTKASWASPSPTEAKTGGKAFRRHRLNLRRPRPAHTLGRHQDVHRSNTGPSTALDSLADTEHC